LISREKERTILSEQLLIVNKKSEVAFLTKEADQLIVADEQVQSADVQKLLRRSHAGNGASMYTHAAYGIKIPFSFFRF